MQLEWRLYIRSSLLPILPRITITISLALQIGRSSLFLLQLLVQEVSIPSSSSPPHAYNTIYIIPPFLSFLLHTIGVIDLPDDITLSKAPVKCTSSKVVLVRNVGNRDTRFTLSTESPWKVNPKSGFLAEGERMQIEIFFTPQVIAISLFIQYELY